MEAGELKQLIERLEAELALVEAKLAEPDYSERSPQLKVDQERAWREELRVRIAAHRAQLQPLPVPGSLPDPGVGRWSPLALYEKQQGEEENVADNLPPAPLAEAELPDREAISREVSLELTKARPAIQRLTALARQWHRDAPTMRLLSAALRSMGMSSTAAKLGAKPLPPIRPREVRPGPTPWLSMATELPDEFDGLTATQRLLLKVMQIAAPPGGPFLRLSEIAGEVSQRDPKCDLPAVERALISLGHPSLRPFPLVEFQGFTGQLTPQDTHLTHARLTRVAIEVLEERFPLPLVLVNGAEGMGACIPPHRPSELLEACLILLVVARLDVLDLMGRKLEGPDFADGGLLVRTGIEHLWRYGKTPMVRRARSRLEVDAQSGQARIVLEDFPWPRSATAARLDLLQLKDEGALDGVIAIVDHASASGGWLAMELEHIAFSGPVQTALRESRVLECAWEMDLLVHDSSGPRRLDLIDLLRAFIEHRREVAVKKLDRALAQARLRAQDAEAVCVALALLEPVQAIMRASDNDAQAVAGLMNFMGVAEREASLTTLPFPPSHAYAKGFTERQARHLLSVRKLASRRPESARQDWAAQLDVCKEAAGHLNDRQAILDVVRQELRDALVRFEGPRRTEIVIR